MASHTYGIIGLVLVAGAAAIVLPTTSDRPESESAAPVRNESLVQLESALWKVHRAWNRRTRDQAQRDLKKVLTRPGLPAALVILLADRGDTLLLEAIRAAGTIACKDARTPLLVIREVGDTREKAAAFAALDRLHPLDEGELSESLASGEESEILGALLVAAQRPALRAEQIAEFIGHKSPEIAELAVETLPHRLNAAAMLRILIWLNLERSRDFAARALNKTVIDEVAEREITRWLDEAPHLRRYLLTLLAKMGRALRDPAPVIMIALGESAEDAVQEILAVTCLERTRTPVAAPEFLESVTFKGPAIRYFVARLLLAQGEQQGLEILLDLVAEEVWDTHGVDTSLVTMTRLECRQVVADLFQADPDRLEKQLARLRRDAAKISDVRMAPSTIRFPTELQTALEPAVDPGK